MEVIYWIHALEQPGEKIQYFLIWIKYSRLWEQIKHRKFSSDIWIVFITKFEFISILPYLKKSVYIGSFLFLMFLFFNTISSIAKGDIKGKTDKIKIYYVTVWQHKMLAIDLWNSSALSVESLLYEMAGKSSFQSINLLHGSCITPQELIIPAYCPLGPNKVFRSTRQCYSLGLPRIK